MDNHGKWKRNLYICNTTYQLIVCVHLVMKHNQCDLNDIILTDRTDFSRTANALRGEKIFNCVMEIHPKALYKGKGTNELKWMKMQDVLAPMKILKYRYKISLGEYDTLYACNMADTVVMEVYSALKKKNPALETCEFEDGYGTYVRPLRVPGNDKSKTRLAYRIMKTPFLTSAEINRTFLFFPELYVYPDNIPKEKLQPMDMKNPEIAELLQRVFGCQEYHISRKYIILEESFKAEGEVNNAEELFTTIIDWVGEENVMLKTHPRNGGNSYHERNVQIFDAPVAWEALIATENMDDKVLITCTSGTSINTKLLYHSKCKIVFLYRLLEGDLSSLFLSPVTQQYLGEFKKNFAEEVFVPENVQELKEVILQMHTEIKEDNQTLGSGCKSDVTF